MTSSTTDASCKWQVTKRELAQRTEHILEKGQWTDCKFIVGDKSRQKIFAGHKLILAISSPVFEAMFYGEMAEKNDPVLIDDVQSEVFEALLEYIYTSKVYFQSFEMACELFYCAEKYILPFLNEECIKFISSNLTPKNACRGYEFAKLFEKPSLMNECLEIINAEAEIVLKNLSFVEIKLETLMTIFEQENLKIESEFELVFAAERWARSECVKNDLDPEDKNSLQSVIGNALTKVRFLTLTPQKFAEGAAKSSLLKENEALAILTNILSRDHKVPMPEAFSTDTAPRKKKVVESSSDYHCCRTSIDRIDCQGVLVSMVNFTADKDIRIIGLEVPTQVSIEEISPNERFSYAEKFSVELYDSSGKRLFEEYFTLDVETDSFAKVEFNNPIHVKKHKVHHVVVSFEVAGTYPLRPCRQRISCDDSVSFSFGVANSGGTVNGELIRSLIFSREKYYYH